MTKVSRTKETETATVSLKWLLEFWQTEDEHRGYTDSSKCCLGAAACRGESRLELATMNVVNDM